MAPLFFEQSHRKRRPSRRPTLALSPVPGYSRAMRRLSLVVFVVLTAASPLLPEEAFQARQYGEPFSLVGMTLAELLDRFGPPRSVYTARGNEEWQDDVVFVYSEGDFYMYRDRVWQIALKSVYGVKLGDSKPAALLVLGDAIQDQGDYAVLPLDGGGWPLALRLDFGAAGLVSAIFIYRPDF